MKTKNYEVLGWETEREFDEDKPPTHQLVIRTDTAARAEDIADRRWRVRGVKCAVIDAETYD